MKMRIFTLSLLMSTAVAFPVMAQDATNMSPSMSDDRTMTMPQLGGDGLSTAQPDLAAELGIDPEKFKGLAPEEILLLTVQEQMKKELLRLDELKPDIPSLFFGEQQYALLQSAMMGFEQNIDMAGLRDQVGRDTFDALPDDADPFAMMREIMLGGIVYKGDADWIVWLNKQRLTPKRLPPQVQSIKVGKGFVDIKWFDQQTKEVIPVRLRPNQRFNLDTRSFLPG